MKPIVLLSLLITGGFAYAEVDIFPKPFGMDRYRETVAASPFVVETKVAEEPVAPKENPFANLYLRGIGGVEGPDYVLVQRIGEEKAMRFFHNEPNADGLFVSQVKAGNNFRETKVVMQKGSETGEIGFKEEAIVAASAPPRPNAAQQPQQFNKPGMPQIPGSLPGSAPGSIRVTPPPIAAPIPRPQAPTTVPLPRPVNNVPNIPAPAVDPNRRQRVRVINN